MADAPDDQSSDDLALVFVTLTLREAQRVEALLHEWGIEHVVRAEPIGRTIFGFARHAACFYVAPAVAPWCVSRLSAAGFAHGVIQPDP